MRAIDRGRSRTKTPDRARATVRFDLRRLPASRERVAVLHFRRHFLFMVLLTGLTVRAGAAAAAAEPPPVVQTSRWNGFDRLDFTVAGRPCILLGPATFAPGRPWIWRTEFFG